MSAEGSGADGTTGGTDIPTAMTPEMRTTEKQIIAIQGAG